MLWRAHNYAWNYIWRILMLLVFQSWKKWRVNEKTTSPNKHTDCCEMIYCWFVFIVKYPLYPQNIHLLIILIFSLYVCQRARFHLIGYTSLRKINILQCGTSQWSFHASSHLSSTEIFITKMWLCCHLESKMRIACLFTIHFLYFTT